MQGSESVRNARLSVTLSSWRRIAHGEATLHEACGECDRLFFSSGERPEKGLSKPLRFVVLLGVVSLFANVTSKEARSVTGPYLAFVGYAPPLRSDE
ncbi:MAG: hypothetical protein WCF10_11135 [Polyangiales bacterium]